MNGPRPNARPCREPAVVAAAWWTKKLTQPTLDANSLQPRLNARPNTATHRISDEQRERFTRALAAGVDQRMDLHGMAELTCVYSPRGILLDVAEASGIPAALFPRNAKLDVFERHIRVTESHRTTLLWSAADWQRPPCDQRRHIEENDEVWLTNELCSRPLLHAGACGDWKPDPRRCVCGGQYADHFDLRGNRGLCRQWYTSTLPPAVP